MQRRYFVFVVLLMALLGGCIAPQPTGSGNLAGNQQVASAQPADAHDAHEHGDDHTHALDEVNFPIACTADAQAEFNQGMTLLHSFWFAPAIQSFNKVIELDPTCGMAHWGTAMSLMGNPFTWPRTGQALVDGWAAVEKAGATGVQTAREQGYVDAVTAFYKHSVPIKPNTPALSYACAIEPYICAKTLGHRTRALAYTTALAQLVQAYPDDTEAQIFYALALTTTALTTDKSYSNQLQAVEILEKIFTQQPDHPGIAHYLIHSNDYPALAQHGLDAALRYAEIAPAAPHALHMPSHIFTRLGLWQESVEMNRASAGSAQEELSATHTQGAGSYNALHAMDYLMYAHLQLAQDGAAQRPQFS